MRSSAIAVFGWCFEAKSRVACSFVSSSNERTAFNLGRPKTFSNFFFSFTFHLLRFCCDAQWTDAEGKYVEKGGIYETQLGVVAHSDGDVIYHSVVDAIFGALTLPDIGQVFQDTDPRWKGCDSSRFMEHAHEVMKRYGYRIGNIDVTLILERPKVASFKPGMKDNIVRLLQTTPGRVNIKARTHERVDSVGELRSLSCHVCLTLERLPEDEARDS
jgi:2-C-methyl-D-erythritol 2,4-cyclodiphosphate synthase